MLTPILMILILVLPALVRRLAALGQEPDLRPTAAIGAGVLFLFTASGHWFQAGPMVQMLPPWVPERAFLVYATGVLEIAIAIALFVPRWRRAGAWTAAAVLVAFFPANIYAAFQHAPMGGHAWGPVYLLVRAPLQLFILGWLWMMVLKTPARH